MSSRGRRRLGLSHGEASRAQAGNEEARRTQRGGMLRSVARRDTGEERLGAASREGTRGLGEQASSCGLLGSGLVCRVEVAGVPLWAGLCAGLGFRSYRNGQEPEEKACGASSSALATCGGGEA